MGIKDKIRYAIQTTADDIEHTYVYAVTGWKKINGEYQFLMPGDDERTVTLAGKMQGYHMEHSCELADVAGVYGLLESETAPANILYTLMAFTFLSPLNHFLKRAGTEPKFVLFLVGRTGCRKSTLAALFLSFFGNFTGANLPLSFQDTANSIVSNTFALKDVLTCIDDYHPAGRKAEAAMNDTAQKILRAYGDRTARARLRSDSTPMEARPPQGNAIITGEFPSDVGESGTARYFALEMQGSEVDLEQLSVFQQLAERGSFQRCMYGYIEWLKNTYLSDEDSEKRFIADLKETFERYRNAFYAHTTACHGRVAESVAWLRIGMEYFLSFLQAQDILEPKECEEHDHKFQQLLYDMAKCQTESIRQDKPAHKFILKLNALLESEQCYVLNKDNGEERPLHNCIGFEDSDYYYLFTDAALTAVKKLCDSQDESFTIRQKALLRQLAEEDLIDVGVHQNTRAVRLGGTTRRVMCLKKAAVQKLLDDGM